MGRKSNCFAYRNMENFVVKSLAQRKEEEEWIISNLLEDPRHKEKKFWEIPSSEERALHFNEQKFLVSV